ncbi:MAG: hypothetical protein LBQ15_01040 [Clostridium sp.]|jgi:hypothetical protein|nr:hypothetical protein [Clostridium sp.]
MGIRKNHFRPSALLLLLAAMLSSVGCGSRIPEMTREQEEAVKSYAVSLLLKYDKNHIKRLVDLEAAEDKAPSASAEETPPPEEAPLQEEGAETLPAPPVPEEAKTLEQLLGLAEGVTVDYQGFQVVSAYPDADGEDVSFGIDATAGNQLLVLRFRISNQSSAEQSVDVVSKNLGFQVVLNGTESKRTLFTALMDDLSIYAGDLPSGGSVDTALLVEVAEAKAAAIESLSLTVKSETGTTTIPLP